MDQIPLIVIVGPTASGKSALAMHLAQKFNGEIIAADSRTIYKGMDIGTAKPTADDQMLIRHHLLDIVTPDQRFTVANFKERALAAIIDVGSRGKVPLLVGGSGLYVDAVIYDFTFRKSSLPIEQRQELESLSVTELQQRLTERGIALPTDDRNPRHLIRALESGGQSAGRSALRPRTLVLGLAKDKQELELAISERIERMIAKGFIDEVKRLSEDYNWEQPAFDSPGYKQLHAYLMGRLSLEEAKKQFVQAHLQYSKRQKTWFKRSRDIIWISRLEEAVDLATTFLNK